ncbi:hypothetical protein P3L10_029309 [Capsicum annuum]
MAYILLIVVVFFFFFFFLQSFVATIKRRSEGTNRMEISQGSKIAMWLFDFCSLLYANLITM